MSRSAHADALALLARRELSQAQVRERLIRRGHDAESIASALATLVASGAIDDARAAGAIARTETTVRRRGRLRVRQRLAAAGIPPEIAERALDEAFEQVDTDALLASALERRLAGRTAIVDEREFARLYRHFVAQGFESDRVFRLLRARTSGE